MLFSPSSSTAILRNGRGISATIAASSKTFPFTACRYSSSRRPSRRPLIGRYRTTPIELFRVNSGKDVILRDYAVQRAKGRFPFDLHLGPDGLVHPRLGPNFEGPNGASLRPLGPTLQEIVRTFESWETTIYRLPEGLELPKELVLLHEHSDHYSIQTAEPTPLEELNTRITGFFKKHGEVMGKNEWCDRYPY